MKYEFKNCSNCILQEDCRHGYTDFSPYGCVENERCYWKPQEWIKRWLNSFDTASATECFTAVNLLKESIENDKR